MATPRSPRPPAAAPRPPAAAGWQLEFAAAPIHVGDELLVVEWRCDGSHRRWSREALRYQELGLQREGSHLRCVGRDRRLVDATVATLNASGDDVAQRSNGPQRTTSILVRGALADEAWPRLPARFAPVSRAAARLHARLLAAPDPLAAHERALTLVAQVADDAGAPGGRAALDASPARRALAEAAQHEIANRFAERLTLDELAAACGASTFYLCRTFRAVTGQTVHRHLTRVRLLAALYRLRAATGQLTELALAVGFSSHSHFTHAFRAEFGCAPSAIA